MMFITEASFL